MLLVTVTAVWTSLFWLLEAEIFNEPVNDESDEYKNIARLYNGDLGVGLLVEDAGKNGFKHEEKMAVLMKHNALRAREESNNMRRLHWDYSLEAIAQSHADTCNWKHSHEELEVINMESFKYIGENIYTTAGSLDPDAAVELWYNETAQYNFIHNNCSGVCDHYLQETMDAPVGLNSGVWPILTTVVAAKTYALGCGVRYCPNLERSPFGYGFFMVCTYGPALIGGSKIRQRPFIKGNRCSDCPRDTKFCVDELCALRPRIGSSSPRTYTLLSSHIYFALMTVTVCQLMYKYVTL